MELSPRTIALPAALLLASTLALAGCSTASTGTTSGDTGSNASSVSENKDEMKDEMKDEESESSPASEASAAPSAEAMAPGAYLTLDEYKSQMADRADTRVVYFFNADWCPSCRATNEALTSEGVPDGLTVVKVDYDTENDLKKMYGVTQQHTFVQVDSNGKELAKWSGSADGEEIKKNTVA